jgi:hypothetical protein
VTGELSEQIHRIVGSIGTLRGLADDRARWDGNPLVWLLGVASVAETIRSAALDAYSGSRESAEAERWDAPGLIEMRDLLVQALALAGESG